MPFARTVLTSKQNYTAQDRAEADAVYAKWRELEPRCDKGRDEVLRLRDDGPMIRWDGSGTDVGLWLQISFLRKPNNAVRLVAAASNITDRPQAVRLIARTIKDVLDGGASSVYYYVTAKDQQGAPEWHNVLAAIVGKLDELFPTVFAVREQFNANEKRWEVAPA